MEPIVKLPLTDKMEFLADGQLLRLRGALATAVPEDLQVPPAGAAPSLPRLALARLLRLLQREGRAEPQELEDYLSSLGLQSDCQRALTQLLLAPAAALPLRLRPRLLAVRWLVDISCGEVNGGVLLLRWSDGTGRCVRCSTAALRRLRLSSAAALGALCPVPLPS